MNFNIYHSPKLNIQLTLIAQTIILKTEEIDKILDKYYGTVNPQIIDESKFFKEIILETSKEKLDEYFSIGRDVYDQLLEPIKKFLEDASLALSMYENTKEFISKITLEDIKNRKPIDGIPLDQFQRLLFIYAHSFLDAIVKIANTIFVMTKQNKTPFIPDDVREKLTILKDEFDNEFPHVRDIRHSWQHIEDRMRGKGQNEKNIESLMLVLSTLYNDNLTYTISDGTQHHITINLDTFKRAEYYVQQTFDSFKWVKGRNR
ncbi:hypothetical protein [Flavobacterium sp. C3NV]|uniref:hypothetical protein n=1 Tax=Flavobacterium sp. C3NV TaxID=3393358 RepID=UPI00398FC552